MYLFVDTETSGLSTATSRSVQIAWVLADPAGHALVRRCHIVRPDGFHIEPGAARVHGISRSRANDEGEPIKDVLLALKESLDLTDVLVGHNLQFDVSILENDARSAELELTLHDLPRICTMRASTTWCGISKLNGRQGFKWPTLGELHRRCFGYEFGGAHDALRDVEATKRCFFRLIDLGVIELPEAKTAIRRTETACPYCKKRTRLPIGIRGRVACRTCRGMFYVNRTFATPATQLGIPNVTSETGDIMRRLPCGSCGQVLRIPHNRRGLATCPKCKARTLFSETEW